MEFPNEVYSSLDSFCSGGIFVASNAGIKDWLFKCNGRWVSEIAKDEYVEDDIDTLLFVFRKPCLYKVQQLPENHRAQ